MGIEDGDYVYVDGDPEDRPFRGWQEKPDDYKVHRAMMRAATTRGLPRGVARSWFNMYVATYGTVEAHENREDGLGETPAPTTRPCSATAATSRPRAPGCVRR
jgi:nitrate reductase / nitrite oxidoreductase, alpha subunit